MLWKIYLFGYSRFRGHEYAIIGNSESAIMSKRENVGRPVIGRTRNLALFDFFMFQCEIYSALRQSQKD